jgi:uncharacterized membrane protein (DUF485 family)
MSYADTPIRTRAPKGCSIALAFFIVAFILAAILTWRWK